MQYESDGRCKHCDTVQKGNLARPAAATSGRQVDTRVAEWEFERHRQSKGDKRQAKHGDEPCESAVGGEHSGKRCRASEMRALDSVAAKRLLST